MNRDKILELVKELISDLNNYKNKTVTYDSYESFTNEMNEKYSELRLNYSVIFNLTLKGEMNINILEYMISTLSKIDNNEISKEKGEYSVGEMLVDKILKRS